MVMAHRLSCPEACGIFPDQRLNWGLLHWQADSLPLSHQEAPTISRWVIVSWSLLCLFVKLWLGHTSVCMLHIPWLLKIFFFYKQSLIQGTGEKCLLCLSLRIFHEWKSEPSSTSTHFKSTHKTNAQNSQVKLLSFVLRRPIAFLPDVWKMSQGENSLGQWLILK